MPATLSTIARLAAALVLVAASIASPTGSAAAVPTREPTDGTDSAAVLPDRDLS